MRMSKQDTDFALMRDFEARITEWQRQCDAMDALSTARSLIRDLAAQLDKARTEAGELKVVAFQAQNSAIDLAQKLSAAEKARDVALMDMEAVHAALDRAGVDRSDAHRLYTHVARIERLAGAMAVLQARWPERDTEQPAEPAPEKPRVGDHLPTKALQMLEERDAAVAAAAAPRPPEPEQLLRWIAAHVDALARLNDDEWRRGVEATATAIADRMRELWPHLEQVVRQASPRPVSPSLEPLQGPNA